MTVEKGVGADIWCEWDPFQERLYEVIVTASENQSLSLEKKMDQQGLKSMKIGQTLSSDFIYRGYFRIPVSQIQTAYLSHL